MESIPPAHDSSAVRDSIADVEQDDEEMTFTDCVVALHNNGTCSNSGISHLLFKHKLSDPNTTKKDKEALVPATHFKFINAGAILKL
jgi:hypothetical protein